VALRGRVGIAVVAGKGEGLVELAVAVFGHDRGYRKPRRGVEGPSCPNSR
jgi:hypothetical protein